MSKISGGGPSSFDLLLTHGIVDSDPLYYMKGETSDYLTERGYNSQVPGAKSKIKGNDLKNDEFKTQDKPSRRKGDWKKTGLIGLLVAIPAVIFAKGKLKNIKIPSLKAIGTNISNAFSTTWKGLKGILPKSKP